MTSSEGGPGGRIAARVARLDASLLPKILGAFVLVLVGASMATLLIDTSLTRAALQDQSEAILRSQVGVLEKITSDRRVLLTGNITAIRDEIELQDGIMAAEPATLDARVSFLARTLSLQVVNAFDASGELIASANRLQVERPPAELFRTIASRPISRVVRLVSGGHAQVVGVLIGREPDRVLLVAGNTLGPSTALELREALAGPDLAILAVDGEVVSATDGRRRDLAALDVPTSVSDLDEGGLTRVVDLGGEQTFVRFATIAAADDLGWGRYAALGVAIPEPLASLDRALLRNRVLMILVLIGTSAALAWVVTSIVTRPLVELTETASAIAGGDLDASFGASSNDEIGVLAGALERMRRVLRAQLHVIRRQAALLQDAARRVVAAQDEERRRLARDLHDGVQQQLVMLRLRVGFARARLRTDASALDDVTDDLGQEIDRIIEGLRETGQDIFPSILQDRGLQGALFSLAGRSAVPLDVTASPDPLPRFDADLEANAYFLVSEAVTNAVKHGRARRITVVAQLIAGELRVTVKDDGRGFDVDRSLRSSGMNHMHDRASAVGGTLRVRSSPASGTTITAIIPVSVAGALEEEEDGGDTPVEVDLLGQPELAEDGVGVLLDGPFGDEQIPGDGGVPLP